MNYIDPRTELIIRHIQADEISGRKQTPIDKFALVRKLYEVSPPSTMEPLLPLLYNFKNKPLTLTDYKPLAPMFMTDRPHRMLWKCCRQVGKSLNGSAACITMGRIIPNFNILIMTPLGEQIKRFVTNYINQLLSGSPFESFLLNKEASQTLTQKIFPNFSKLIFSFASQSADRIRGINADMIYLDEVQDFAADNLSVIEATAAAADKEFFLYSGTPKSRDNAIQKLWEDSSQAEWWVKCPHCNADNIPALEYDIEGMIGPYRDDISKDSPATICHKCKRTIYPRTGEWVDRFPDRKSRFAAYHISQVIMPVHNEHPDKWLSLLENQQGTANSTRSQFCNECLGESVDAGQKLITLTDLETVCNLPWDNNPNNPSQEVLDRLNRYPHRMLAVDWAGGGAKLVSFTTLGLLGMRPDGQIDVLWGKRLTASQDHAAEGRECLYWMTKFGASHIVHDYSGAGTIRETILIQSGIPANRIIPISLVPSTRSDLLSWHPPEEHHSRGYYTTDKTRSLLYMVTALKSGILHFFRYDGALGSVHSATTEEKLRTKLSLMDDFLSLIEEKMTSRFSSDTYLITKPLRASDDFAQAINIGCLALWHKTQAWPRFASNNPNIQQELSSFDEGLMSKYCC